MVIIRKYFIIIKIRKGKFGNITLRIENIKPKFIEIDSRLNDNNRSIEQIITKTRRLTYFIRIIEK